MSTSTQQYQPDDWRAGQARRAARADQRRCRGAGCPQRFTGMVALPARQLTRLPSITVLVALGADRWRTAIALVTACRWLIVNPMHTR